MADAKVWGSENEKLIRSEGCGLVLRSPRDTEAVVVAVLVGPIVAAIRRAAAEGVAGPAAAALHTVGPSRRSCWVRRVARGVNLIPIIAPLPHIA